MANVGPRTLCLFVSKTYYEDPPAGGGNPPADPPANPPKTFTQSEVDRFLAEDRRKHQAKQTAVVGELEKLRDSLRLGDEEKSTLQARIDEIKNESMTKEQSLQRDLEKANNTVKTTTETLTKEKEVWQSRYASLLVKNDIISSAAKNEAYNNDQVLELLKPKAKVVQKKDDAGKLTDEFQVFIRFEDVDAKTKQPVVLELSAEDTVKRMKELPELFGNLFKSGVQAGVGKTRSGGPIGEPNLATMTPKEFREYRKTRGT